MSAWLEAAGFWLADVYLLATGLMLLAAIGTRLLRQPVERLELCRAVTFCLAAVAALTLLPFWPRWRAPDRGEAVARHEPADAVEQASPVAHSHAAATASAVDSAAAQAAKLSEAFAAMDALLGSAGSQEQPSRDPLHAGRTTDATSNGIAFGPSSDGAAGDHRRASAEPYGFAAAAQPPARPEVVERPLPPSESLTAWNWPLWCGGAFAVGSACTALWLLLGALQTAWLRCRSSEAPPELRALLRDVVGDGRPPRLALSARLAQPVALGVLRPGVLLPGWLARSLPEDDLRAVLAHEWAHIRRGDLLLLAASRALSLVLFAHPLFWWLRARVRLDQELVADAAAAGDDATIDYAERLLQWTRMVGTRRGSVVALALGERPSQLQERIDALLDPDVRVALRCGRRCRCGVWSVAGAAAAILSLATLRPLAPAAALATDGAGDLASVTLPAPDGAARDLSSTNDPDEALPAPQAGPDTSATARSAAQAAPASPRDPPTPEPVVAQPEPLEEFDPAAPPQYRWRPGRSASYRIRLEADLDGGTEIAEGQSDYTVQAVDEEGVTLSHFGYLPTTPVVAGGLPGALRFGPAMRLGFPRFPGPHGAVLKLDSTGRFVSLDGSSPLPFHLGDLASIALDPLPAGAETTWQETASRTLVPDGEGPTWGWGAWPMTHAMTIDPFPWSERAGRLPFDWPGIGPPAWASMGPSRFVTGPLGRPSTTLLSAEERREYTLDAAPGRIARIHKTFEMASIKLSGEAPLYQLAGSGTIEFDRARGWPRSVVLEATLTDRSGGAERSIPLRLTCDSIDPAPPALASADE